MGLLDNKSRFFDTIITSEGRKQIANGHMNICYASFTDADAYYEKTSGVLDTTSRQHFEAFSRPQDTITFEADDVGMLVQFKGSTGGVISGHVLIASGTNFLNYPSSISQRTTSQYSLLSSSFDNFRQQYIIGTPDLLTDDINFSLSHDEIIFDITTNSNVQNKIDVNNALSLFQDRRFTHAPNFLFMPPITRLDNGIQQLGNYQRLDQGDSYSFDELQQSLINKQHETVRFIDTSRNNNIYAQFFEISDILVKLDIIDFGEFNNNGTNVHVLFAGRIVNSDAGHTFFNIFTLLLS